MLSFYDDRSFNDEGRMEGWKEGWKDGWKDGWMNEWMVGYEGGPWEAGLLECGLTKPW